MRGAIAGVIVGLIGVIILHGGGFGCRERAGRSASCSALRPPFSYGIVGAAGAAAICRIRRRSRTATFQMLASRC